MWAAYFPDHVTEACRIQLPFNTQTITWKYSIYVNNKHTELQ